MLADKTESGRRVSARLISALRKSVSDYLKYNRYQSDYVRPAGTAVINIQLIFTSIIQYCLWFLYFLHSLHHIVWGGGHIVGLGPQRLKQINKPSCFLSNANVWCVSLNIGLLLFLKSWMYVLCNIILCGAVKADKRSRIWPLVKMERSSSCMIMNVGQKITRCMIQPFTSHSSCMLVHLALVQQ